jgi:DNA-binding CsgD family transcriptional regulator
MLTKTFAKNFVNRMADTLFIKGNVNLIHEFYAKDVVLHYRDEIFYIDEICRRFLAIKLITTRFHITIEELFVVDDLILFRSRQTWKNRINKALHESVVFFVCRIRDKKISEMWFTVDEPATSYADVNRNFDGEMLAFQLDFKDKNIFLKRLGIAMQFHDNMKFSKVEKDCLYYYFHGFSAKDTALKMNLSYRTIQTYISQIKERFNCKTKLALRKKIFF